MLWCWESTTRDAIARNLGASKSTVSASRQIFSVLKIVNAWTAKILKAVRRGKLSSMVIIPTAWHISSRLQMLPSPMLLVPQAMDPLHYPREEKVKSSFLGQLTKIHPFID